MAGPGISISWQGNRAACQSTAWLTSDSKGHLWALLPLSLSLGTGESPVLVALEAFTISSAAMLSESLEEVQTGILRLFARGHWTVSLSCVREQGIGMTLILGNTPSLSSLVG